MRRLLLLAAVALAAAMAAAGTPAQAQQTPLSRRPLAVPPEINPAEPGGSTRALPPVAAPPRRVTPPPPSPPAERRARRTTREARRSAARPNGGQAVASLAESGALARDLEAALEIDAAARAIRAQRDAVRARDALVRSPIPGSPAIGGSLRSDLRGPREAREMDLELAAPIWLPGQRSALAGTVEAGVAEQEYRFALRRLEVAQALRDAYWAVGAADSELRVARDRLATARDIGRDFNRRAELGDISATDALLGRNETLAAELDLARAEAAAESARAAYRTLTGGSAAALSQGDAPGLAGRRPEAMAPPNAVHPALRAAEAALATAEARARLVAATPRDNPELGVFARGQAGPLTEEGVSMGLRLRLPLATEARNAPRRADAEAERSRAQAELLQARRLVEGEIGLARVALRAAEESRRLAGARRGVAQQQLDAARIAFRAGEIGAFDLFRVRQLQLEAVAADARAQVEAGRARSRLNQALGIVPGG